MYAIIYFQRRKIDMYRKMYTFRMRVEKTPQRINRTASLGTRVQMLSFNKLSTCFCQSRAEQTDFGIRRAIRRNLIKSVVSIRKEQRREREGGGEPVAEAHEAVTRRGLHVTIVRVIWPHRRTLFHRPINKHAANQVSRC